jgi:hypothetical protein
MDTSLRHGSKELNRSSMTVQPRKCFPADVTPFTAFRAELLSRSEGSLPLGLEMFRCAQHDNAPCMDYPHRSPVRATTSYTKQAELALSFRRSLELRCADPRQVTMWVIHTDDVPDVRQEALLGNSMLAQTYPVPQAIPKVAELLNDELASIREYAREVMSKLQA